MANLRLDVRDEALRPNRRGLTPIVPGDSAKSHIIQRIFASNDTKMPPFSSHKTLSERQKETIRRWVEEGAKYEGHWAYEPVRRFPGASIDSLVRARMGTLRPSPEADRRTLIRRVSLDLTGIPPMPDEVAAFVNDGSPDAYEKLVERLMASTRYAEKQAMHWLDAVRYADTAGFHGDNPFPAWPYRDYVLRSFHENQPFDQFTREQLAGDLIPNATVRQKTASAFNRILRVSAEGGLQPKEYLAKYGADRVRTTTAVWMGSTLGCAECHDHKFDPFTAKDFYSMKAFFADIKETGLVADRGAKAWGTQLDIATEEQAKQRTELRSAVDAAAMKLEKGRTKSLEAALLRQNASGKLAWIYQRPVKAVADHATLTVYNEEAAPSSAMPKSTRPGDGLVIASGENPENETYTITIAPGVGAWSQIGIQAVQDESLPGLGVARGADRLMISEVEAELLPSGKKLGFLMAAAGARMHNPDQNALNAIDGNASTGWGGSPYHDGVLPFLALRLSEPLKTGSESQIVIRLRHDTQYRRATVGRLRIALSPGPAAPVMDPTSRKHASVDKGLPAVAVAALKKAAASRKDEEKALVAKILDWTDGKRENLVAEWARAAAHLDAFQLEVPRVMVSESTTPKEVRILRRGNFMDESGMVVEPAIPGFLGKLPVTERATRLDLANWLVSNDNPLTARAYVNRQWRVFFGTGLSRVLEDLGSQGDWPVQADLIDFLAAEFMDKGWDRKHVTKLIVMSHTYRQSSAGSGEQDPENRLLARQNRLRVDAEVVRDIALSVSGLLTEEFGGPSVRPYQPEGYLAALNFPKREYAASKGPDQYRRGLYTFWQRTFLHPSLMTFDAASREECTVNRSLSNTPLQALVLLNDPTFVEAARVFAQNTLRGASPASAQARVEWAFRRALGRDPSSEERSILENLYKRGLQKFDSDPAGARTFVNAGDAPAMVGANVVELAATMTVTRAILNLHETITRN
jgi:hypothetical protein